MKMHSIYSKIRNFCENRYQCYGDGFRTHDGNFTFLTNEKIYVLYSDKHYNKIVVLYINEDDGGNIVVTTVSPDHDPLTEKAYVLVKDILSGIDIPMPDTETPSGDKSETRSSDLVRVIQAEIDKDKMRLVELLDKTADDVNLSTEETEELEGLCCRFFITRHGSLDWDNFKEVISNCKSKEWGLGPGERDSFGLLSAIIICPNDHRIVFG